MVLSIAALKILIVMDTRSHNNGLRRCNIPYEKALAACYIMESVYRRNTRHDLYEEDVAGLLYNAKPCTGS